MGRKLGLVGEERKDLFLESSLHALDVAQGRGLFDYQNTSRIMISRQSFHQQTPSPKEPAALDPSQTASQS